MVAQITAESMARALGLLASLVNIGLGLYTLFAVCIFGITGSGCDVESWFSVVWAQVFGHTSSFYCACLTTRLDFTSGE